jgi:hypothetical protein
VGADAIFAGAASSTRVFAWGTGGLTEVDHSFEDCCRRPELFLARRPERQDQFGTTGVAGVDHPI